MKRYLLPLIPLAFAFSFAMPPATAVAGTVVKVELWDNMTGSDMPTNFKYGTPNVDLSKAPMGMRVTPDTAPAGQVTFDVTNVSKNTVHEMIVMYRANPAEALPFIDDENRVDEDK